MFPARGIVAVLLLPRVASAVLGSDDAASTAVALRPLLGFDRLEDRVIGNSLPHPRAIAFRPHL
jgi:hypothetical protein